MKTAEHQQSLMLMIASPLIWFVHFMACYLTAAIWCAKQAERVNPLGPVRWAIGAFTLLALAGIGWNGLWGFKRMRLEGGSLPFDADNAEDRHRFLGQATFLLAGLSAIAVIFEGAVAFYFKTCE